VSDWIAGVVVSYIPSAARSLMDGTSCLVYNLTAFFGLMIGLFLVASAAKTFGLPFLSTSAAIGLSLFSEWIPTAHIWYMFFTLMTVAIVAVCYLLIMFRASKIRLNKNAVPSGECLNQTLEPFFICRDLIKVLPLAIIIWHTVDSM
jgi:heme/copper-type cytochrome/quinol oxidase subunit 2